MSENFKFCRLCFLGLELKERDFGVCDPCRDEESEAVEELKMDDLREYFKDLHPADLEIRNY